MTCDRSAAAHSCISLVWFHDRGDFRGSQRLSHSSRLLTGSGAPDPSEAIIRPPEWRSTARHAVSNILTFQDHELRDSLRSTRNPP